MRLLVFTIVFLMSGICSAHDDGMRPNGMQNIGSVYSNDSIPIDRANREEGLKTTPADLKNYVQSQLNGVMAPATHSHPLATTTTDGLQSAADKVTLAAVAATSPVTSITEGAIGDGTWRSLASLGHTVATAQAAYPYLTVDGKLGSIHLIQTTQALADFGNDWAGLQHGVHRARETGIGKMLVVAGIFMLEQSIIIEGVGLYGMYPVPDVRNGYSNAPQSIVRPHTTFPVSSGLINAKHLSSVKNLKLEHPVTRGHTYIGLLLNSGSEGLGIQNNEFRNFIVGIKTDSSSNINALLIEKNVFAHCKTNISLNGTGGNDVIIRGNFGYNENYDYVHGTNVLYIAPTVANNIEMDQNKWMYYIQFIEQRTTIQGYMSRVKITNNHFQGGNDSQNTTIPFVLVSYPLYQGSLVIKDNWIQGSWSGNGLIEVGNYMSTDISHNQIYHNEGGPVVYATKASCPQACGIISITNNLRHAYAGTPIGKWFSSGLLPGNGITVALSGNTPINDSQYDGMDFTVVNGVNPQEGITFSVPDLRLRDRADMYIPLDAREFIIEPRLPAEPQVGTLLTLRTPSSHSRPITIYNQASYSSTVRVETTYLSLIKNLSNTTVDRITMPAGSLIELTPYKTSAGTWYWKQVR